MGIVDKLKGLIRGREKQVKQGIDKAADTVSDKVGAKNAARVDQVADKAKGAVDKLAE